MSDTVSVVGNGQGTSTNAPPAEGDDAARQAEFEAALTEAIGLFAAGDVLSEDLESESRQREYEAEDPT